MRRGAANSGTDVVEPRAERIDPADLGRELSSWAVGLGIIAVALFPLAVPLVALTALAALPLVLLALVAALLALPFLAIRGLVRRVTATTATPEHEPTRGPGRGWVEITR